MRFFKKKQAKPVRIVDEGIECNFCYKSALEVETIISAPKNIYICEECVDRCVKILESAKAGKLESYRP